MAENEEKIEMKVNVGILKEMFETTLKGYVNNSLLKNKENIEKSLDKLFNNGTIFSTKASEFESAMDWAIETEFRDGITKALQELNFKEMIAKKAKEILTNNDFITQLAEDKIRASLGLPKKETN